MIQKENKLLQYASLISGIAALVYIWFYNFFFLPNPAYGDRASTASNVGRDHWAAFILWGLLLECALALNLLFAADKFGVRKKLLRVLCAVSTLGCFGFVLCKNEKFKRFTVSVSFDQYTGAQKSNYSEQTLVSSKPLFSFFWSKKSMHSAFSIVFGVCLALAILYFLAQMSRTNRKFRHLSFVFLGYVVIAAICLKRFLGGTAELVAITAVMIPMLIINHTGIMLDPDAPEGSETPAPADKPKWKNDPG